MYSGNGAHGSMSRFGGGNQGSNYTFRGYQSNPGVQGNWNTGGRVTGQGSLARGIAALPNGDTNRVGMPTSPRPAMVEQLMPQPAAAIPPSIPTSLGPKYRVDLNSATLAPLTPRTPLGMGGPRGGFGPGFGSVQFGPASGGKFQDRHPGMNNGFGRVGGGRGGGGGGGW